MADFAFPPVAGQMWPRGGVVVASGFADTFNRADTTGGLGTTSDGLAAWTVNSGTGWRITSNRAAVPNSTGMVTLPFTRVVQTVRATAITVANSGPMLRWADVNNHIRLGIVSSNWRVDRVIAGAATSLIAPGVTATANDQIELSIDAAHLLTFKLNGVSRGTATITDSVLLTAVKVGLWANIATCAWDDFMVF